MNLPAYLKKTGFRNPVDGSNGPFQHVHNTKLPFYEYSK